MAKTQKEFEARGRPVKVVSVEDFVLASLAQQRFPEDTQQRRAYLEKLNKPGGFKEVLDEAPKRVQELWRKAAYAAAKKAERILNQGENVFFTFHASYYADKFGDLYSPLDGSLVLQFPRPKRFITFIDDIGDIAARLREEGQVFSRREKTAVKSVMEAIRDLLTILEWRSTELTVSRLIGTLVGVTPFVLAVKHPVRTAVRLLAEEGVPTYVSHSISEPRRFFEKRHEWPPFMEEVQRFTDSLAHSKAGAAIPIVPTSIDELRIDKRSINGASVRVPSLLARWKFPSGNLLVDPLKYEEVHNWLDPRGHFSDSLKRDQLDEKTLVELETVSGLVDALFTRIDNQVNARDHILVTQCQPLVVYRPYVAWRVSDGVAAEVTHHRKRHGDSRKGKRVVIFVHKREDANYRKLGIIVAQAKRFFRWARGAAQVPEEEIGELLKKGLEEHPPGSFSSTGIKERVEEILTAQSIELGGPKVASEGSVLSKTTAAESETIISQLWEEVAKEIAEPDPWKAHADHWIEQDCTPEQFAESVNKLILE